MGACCSDANEVQKPPPGAAHGKVPADSGGDPFIEGATTGSGRRPGQQLRPGAEPIQGNGQQGLPGDWVDSPGSSDSHTAGGDPAVTYCQANGCGAEFNAAVPHTRCHKCGKVCCDACTRHTLPTRSQPGGVLKPQERRVCDMCFEQSVRASASQLPALQSINRPLAQEVRGGGGRRSPPLQQYSFPPAAQPIPPRPGSPVGQQTPQGAQGPSRLSAQRPSAASSAATGSPRGVYGVALPRARWQPDSDSRNCGICSKEFTWRTRRHHCRLCGRLACAACSAHSLRLQQADGSGVQKARVCDQCLTQVVSEHGSHVVGSPCATTAGGSFASSTPQLGSPPAAAAVAPSALQPLPPTRAPAGAADTDSSVSDDTPDEDAARLSAEQLAGLRKLPFDALLAQYPLLLNGQIRLDMWRTHWPKVPPVALEQANSQGLFVPRQQLERRAARSRRREQREERREARRNSDVRAQEALYAQVVANVARSDNDSLGRPPSAASAATVGVALPPEQWAPDAAAKACASCSRPFTTLRRRHHCRACGDIFCADCSTGRARLQLPEYEGALSDGGSTIPDGASAGGSTQPGMFRRMISRRPRGSSEVLRVCDSCNEAISQGHPVGRAGAGAARAPDDQLEGKWQDISPSGAGKPGAEYSIERRGEQLIFVQGAHEGVITPAEELGGGPPGFGAMAGCRVDGATTQQGKAIVVWFRMTDGHLQSVTSEDGQVVPGMRTCTRVGAFPAAPTTPAEATLPNSSHAASTVPAPSFALAALRSGAAARAAAAAATPSTAEPSVATAQPSRAPSMRPTHRCDPGLLGQWGSAAGVQYRVDNDGSGGMVFSQWLPDGRACRGELTRAAGPAPGGMPAEWTAKLRFVGDKSRRGADAGQLWLQRKNDEVVSVFQSGGGKAERASAKREEDITALAAAPVSGPLWICPPPRAAPLRSIGWLGPVRDRLRRDGISYLVLTDGAPPPPPAAAGLHTHTVPGKELPSLDLVSGVLHFIEMGTGAGENVVLCGRHACALAAARVCLAHRCDPGAAADAVSRAAGPGAEGASTGAITAVLRQWEPLLRQHAPSSPPPEGRSPGTAVGEAMDRLDWERDEHCSQCTACRSKFTLTRRRHHCRYCGGIFCSACSRGRARLRPRQGGSAQLMRICDACNDQLQEAALAGASTPVCLWAGSPSVSEISRSASSLPPATPDARHESGTRRPPAAPFAPPTPMQLPEAQSTQAPATPQALRAQALPPAQPTQPSPAQSPPRVEPPTPPALRPRAAPGREPAAPPATAEQPVPTEPLARARPAAAAGYGAARRSSSGDLRRISSERQPSEYMRGRPQPVPLSRAPTAETVLRVSSESNPRPTPPAAELRAQPAPAPAPIHAARALVTHTPEQLHRTETPQRLPSSPPLSPSVSGMPPLPRVTSPPTPPMGYAPPYPPYGRADSEDVFVGTIDPPELPPHPANAAREGTAAPPPTPAVTAAHPPPLDPPLSPQPLQAGHLRGKSPFSPSISALEESANSDRDEVFCGLRKMTFSEVLSRFPKLADHINLDVWRHYWDTPDGVPLETLRVADRTFGVFADAFTPRDLQRPGQNPLIKLRSDTSSQRHSRDFSEANGGAVPPVAVDSDSGVSSRRGGRRTGTTHAVPLRQGMPPNGSSSSLRDRPRHSDAGIQADNEQRKRRPKGKASSSMKRRPPQPQPIMRPLYPQQSIRHAPISREQLLRGNSGGEYFQRAMERGRALGLASTASTRDRSSSRRRAGSSSSRRRRRSPSPGRDSAPRRERPSPLRRGSGSSLHAPSMHAMSEAASDAPDYVGIRGLGDVRGAPRPRSPSLGPRRRSSGASGPRASAGFPIGGLEQGLLRREDSPAPAGYPPAALGSLSPPRTPHAPKRSSLRQPRLGADPAPAPDATRRPPSPSHARGLPSPTNQRRPPSPTQPPRRMSQSRTGLRQPPLPPAQQPPVAAAPEPQGAAPAPAPIPTTPPPAPSPQPPTPPQPAAAPVELMAPGAIQLTPSDRAGEAPRYDAETASSRGASAPRSAPAGSVVGSGGAVCFGDALPRSQWQADKSLKACCQCSKSFGAFRRRHHCRACGMLFCDNCSRRSLPLRTPNGSASGMPTSETGSLSSVPHTGSPDSQHFVFGVEVSEVRVCDGCFHRRTSVQPPQRR
eukprot:TRINITY_DN567_c0_g3_i1.p1 TRINITY_DN567_c0_g3~~TRINITY_DN567_c0_g3_i1.p1  ORF type:complete len:2175 (+),score=474.88 TRINITY_DN567_c0_g3_i1:78-6527(+)